MICKLAVQSPGALQSSNIAAMSAQTTTAPMPSSHVKQILLRKNVLILLQKIIAHHNVKTLDRRLVLKTVQLIMKVAEAASAERVIPVLTGPVLLLVIILLPRKVVRRNVRVSSARYLVLKMARLTMKHAEFHCAQVGRLVRMGSAYLPHRQVVIAAGIVVVDTTMVHHILMTAVARVSLE